MPQTAAPSLANDVRILCLHVCRRVRAEAAHELSPRQVSVLEHLADGPLTPSQLAELEHVSAPSITRTVKGLVALGLVDQSRNLNDGRLRMLAISPEGLAMLERVHHAHDDWMVRQFKDLTAQEQATLRQAANLMNRVLAH